MQEDIYLTNVYTVSPPPATHTHTTISYKALTGAHVCLCALMCVCEPFVLLHLKKPSGSVNSVHHNPGECVRFLRRRALVCVCWSVDGVSSDCSDNREPPSIRLCVSLVLKLRECRQTESYQ